MKCFKCLADKSEDFFYKHPAMANGFLGKCKECTKKDAKKHRELNLEKIKKYDRNRPNYKERRIKNNDWAKKNREKVNKIGRRWAAKNRHKRNAHLKVLRAIKSGKIIRGPCERCGTKNEIEGHHEDYSKPLQVMWLCILHHKERHRIINENKRKAWKYGSSREDLS